MDAEKEVESLETWDKESLWADHSQRLENARAKLKQAADAFDRFVHDVRGRIRAENGMADFRLIGVLIWALAPILKDLLKLIIAKVELVGTLLVCAGLFVWEFFKAMRNPTPDKEKGKK